MARVWSWALCFLACIATQTAVLASQFTVGGSNGWTVPSGSNNNTFNQWAARNRFQVGDTILFKYDKTKDSVLQVTPESYNTCNTSGPIKSHTDGNTVLKFSFPGPYHFISGNQSRCRMGEKLILVVITPVSPAPSPIPTAMTAPATSPTPTAMTVPAPSPTPTAMTAPATSPTPTAMTAPATSPTMQSPSPSPSPSMASPSLSPSPSPSTVDSSPSPTPITSPAVASTSPTPTTGSGTPAQTPGSPTVPASGAGGANTKSPSPGPTPPSSSTDRFSALPSLLNVVIPLVFAALLNFRIASI